MTTELATVETTTSIEASLNSIAGEQSTRVVSTLTDSSPETKLAVFSALSDAEDLSEHLGEFIALENVVFQAITIIDEVTKLPVDLIRTILLDVDGTAYATVSTAVFKSLETMFAVLGKPHTWAKPVEVVAVEKKAKLGKFFSLIPVTDKMRGATAKK